MTSADDSRGAVASVMAAHVIARFPASMVALALLIAAERALGSYAQAGLVVAAWSVGAAIAGPLAARGLGRWGVRRTVVVCASVNSLAMLALAFAPAFIAAFLALAAIAGLSTPPVSAAARSAYPRIVSAARVSTVYSVDVTLQQFAWILGPLVVTAAAATMPGLSLLIIASVQLVGAAAFAAVPALRGMRPPVPTTTMPLSTAAIRIASAPGGILRHPALVVCLATILLMMASSGGVETAVVASYGDGSWQTGVLLALWSVGSLVGGVAFARIPVARASLGRRAGIGAVGLVPIAVTIAFPVALAGLFVSGMGSAPTLAAMYVVLARALPETGLAEAYGWLSSAQLVGTAAGTALAGLVADHAGGEGAMALAATFAVAASAVALLLLRTRERT